MKKKYLLKILALTILIISTSSCSIKKSTATATAAVFNSIGVVSINSNISSSESLTTYTSEYKVAFNLGARGAQTAASWNALNPSGTAYDTTLLTSSYFGLAALQGYGFTNIFLNIPVVAIGSRSMPSDISSLAFNHATVKSRIHTLIDTVVPLLNDKVKYVCFGNEVDTYFSAHSSEWSAYIELIEDARTYLQSKKPNILVGVTTTFDGATSSQKSNVATLNTNMDFISLTYYPINGSFVARAPSTVSTDMQLMATISGSKPVVLQEFGYPSSTSISGSLTNQSTFITTAFATWKQIGSTKFPFISFFKFRDWTGAHCTTITSGQTAGQSWYEFMCSLGLLNNDGTQKPAYQVFVDTLSGD